MLQESDDFQEAVVKRMTGLLARIELLELKVSVLKPGPVPKELGGPLACPGCGDRALTGSDGMILYECSRCNRTWEIAEWGPLSESDLDDASDD